MNNSNWTKVFYGSTSIFNGIASMIRKFKDVVSVGKQNDTINEILFYGAEDENKKKHVGLNNLFCIYHIIIHANLTIDVCVPSLFSDTISKCLINVHKKNGTKVRLAIHDSDLSNLKALIDCGVEVREISSSVRLEHEFILIDAFDQYQDAVAIIGSLDYEISRVNCNRDSTIFTSEFAVIESLKREFERVWNSDADENTRVNDSTSEIDTDKGN